MQYSREFILRSLGKSRYLQLRHNGSLERFFFFLSFFFFEQFQLELIVVARTTNITSVFTVCKATDSGAVRA